MPGRAAHADEPLAGELPPADLASPQTRVVDRTEHDVVDAHEGTSQQVLLGHADAGDREVDVAAAQQVGGVVDDEVLHPQPHAGRLA